MSNSDVVVTHAGVGLSLLALANGRCPVVVPRPPEGAGARRRSPDPSRLNALVPWARPVVRGRSLSLEVLRQATRTARGARGRPPASCWRPPVAVRDFDRRIDVSAVSSFKA